MRRFEGRPIQKPLFLRKRGWKGSKLRNWFCFFFFLRGQNSWLIIHTLCTCGLWQIPQDQGRTPLKPKRLNHFLASVWWESLAWTRLCQLDLNRKNALPQMSYLPPKEIQSTDSPEHTLSLTQGWFLPLPHCQVHSEICRSPQIAGWNIRNPNQKLNSQNRMTAH